MVTRTRARMSPVRDWPAKPIARQPYLGLMSPTDHSDSQDKT